MRKWMAWIVLAAALAGCEGGYTETGLPPGVAPIVEDAGCKGLAPNIYITRDSYQVGTVDGAPLLAPLQVIFTRENTVIWSYDDTGPRVGKYECEDGVLSGTFEGGALRAFSGNYEQDDRAVVIEGITYEYYQDSP